MFCFWCLHAFCRNVSNKFNNSLFLQSQWRPGRGSFAFTCIARSLFARAFSFSTEASAKGGDLSTSHTTTIRLTVCAREHNMRQPCFYTRAKAKAKGLTDVAAASNDFCIAACPPASMPSETDLIHPRTPNVYTMFGCYLLRAHVIVMLVISKVSIC